VRLNSGKGAKHNSPVLKALERDKTLGNERVESINTIALIGIEYMGMPIIKRYP
jgi:hypothetical protein